MILLIIVMVCAPQTNHTNNPMSQKEDSICFCCLSNQEGSPGVRRHISSPKEEGLQVQDPGLDAREPRTELRAALACCEEADVGVDGDCP